MNGLLRIGVLVVVGTAQHRPYPHKYFTNAEWFGNVVVGSQIESCYGVVLCIAGCKEDDWNILCGGIAF